MSHGTSTCTRAKQVDFRYSRPACANAVLLCTIRCLCRWPRLRGDRIQSTTVTGWPPSSARTSVSSWGCLSRSVVDPSATPARRQPPSAVNYSGCSRLALSVAKRSPATSEHLREGFSRPFSVTAVSASLSPGFVELPTWPGVTIRPPRTTGADRCDKAQPLPRSDCGLTELMV